MGINCSGEDSRAVLENRPRERLGFGLGRKGLRLAGAALLGQNTALAFKGDVPSWWHCARQPVSSIRPRPSLIWLESRKSTLTFQNMYSVDLRRPVLGTRCSLNSHYRRTPTRLTPPFKFPPALWRTAARATGRGLSTTPALATQPTG